MAVPYMLSAAAPFGTYYTPSSRSHKLSMSQIVENQLASKKWIALYYDEDMRPRAVNGFKQGAVMQGHFNESLLDACRGRMRAAKDKLLPSLCNY